MATIKDVAKKANVSISTASYALNNKPNVSKETRRRILEAAKELGYTPNVTARSLRTNKTGNVGVFIVGFGGPIFSDLLETIHLELIKEGLNIVVSTGKSSKKMLEERQVDAAIVFDTNIKNAELIKFAKDRPVIVLDRTLDSNNIYTSRVENEALVYQLMGEVIKRGYDKLAYLTGPKNTKDDILRHKGFHRALGENNLKTHLVIEGNYTVESGYKAGSIISKLEDKPNFVFASNDEMAVGLLRSLKDKGFKIPNDIAIASFDGIYLGEYVIPKLTTIKIDYQTWGKEVSKAIIKLLKGEETTIPKPKTNIVFRGTV